MTGKQEYRKTGIQENKDMTGIQENKDILHIVNNLKLFL